MMYLAIDYGRKRIGLALGAMIPRGVGVLDGAKPFAEIASAIKDICTSENVETIIIGLPLRSQGEDGEIAKEVRIFAANLESTLAIPVILEPEGFTSAEAERQLKQYSSKISDKGKIDELSAILLLEQYLNNQDS